MTSWPPVGMEREEVMEASLLWGPAGGGEASPRWWGSVHDHLLCKALCQGEWGAERAGGGSGGTVEVEVSKRIGWVFSTGPMPYRSTSHRRLPARPPPRPSHAADATHLLSSILLWHLVLLSLRLAGGLCVISPRGTLSPPSLPPTPERRTYRPLPAWLAPTALLDSDSAQVVLGRPAPTPLAPWGCWTSLAGG